MHQQTISRDCPIGPVGNGNIEHRCHDAQRRLGLDRGRTRRNVAEPTMRHERTVQSSVFDLFAEHEIGRELKTMSQWLDEHRELLGLVTRELRRHGLKETGREGCRPKPYYLRIAQAASPVELSGIGHPS
jgi:IS5 family transposase